MSPSTKQSIIILGVGILVAVAMQPLLAPKSSQLDAAVRRVEAGRATACDRVADLAAQAARQRDAGVPASTVMAALTQLAQTGTELQVVMAYGYAGNRTPAEASATARRVCATGKVE